MAGVKGRSGGHNRKSLAAHKLAGTFRPSRHKGLTEVPSMPAAKTQAPPAYFDEGARAVWCALAPTLAKHGLLTVLDVPRFEILCIHLAYHRRLSSRLTQLYAEQQAGKDVDLSALFRSLRQTADTVRALSVGFGLDPADRARIGVRPTDRENPWAAIAAQPSKWAGLLP